MNSKQDIKFTILGTKEEYDKLFDEICNILPTSSSESILREIRSKLSLVIFIAQSIENKNVENFTFYRIRVQKDNEPKIDENKIDSFSYPPDPLKINRGRANLENEQVFYASGDSHTTFHELADQIKLGSSIVYLSKWGVKPIPPNLFMRSLFFGIDENRENSYASIMAKGVNTQYYNMCKDLPTPLQELFLYYQKRYTELFTIPGPALYHISSAIAHESFHSLKNKDFDSPIIMYPSVAKQKDSVNFAIRKDFVDDYLYLKEVDKFIVTNISQESNSYTPLQRGFPLKGKIKWLNIKKSIKIHNEISISYDKKDLNSNCKLITNTDSLTIGPNQAVSVSKFLHDNGITEKILVESLSRIPVQNFDFSQRKQLDYFFIAETTGNVFLTSELSETKKIALLKVPVSIEFCYE